jgi:hypothetical protein
MRRDDDAVGSGGAENDQSAIARHICSFSFPGNHKLRRSGILNLVGRASSRAGSQNMPLLTELENVLGCDSTKMSPLTGLAAM